MRGVAVQSVLAVARAMQHSMPLTSACRTQVQQVSASVIDNSTALSNVSALALLAVPSDLPTCRVGHMQ